MTLVEAVLAVAILALSIVVLMTGASRCLAVIRVAERYQTAQWVMGMGECDYPMYETNDVRELVLEPGHEYPGGFTYSRVLDEEPFDEKHSLYLLRIRVSWADRGSETVEEVVRCFYQPEEEEKP
jgi:hypothetical protein